jgi:hypothetical protein
MKFPSLRYPASPANPSRHESQAAFHDREGFRTQIINPQVYWQPVLSVSLS